MCLSFDLFFSLLSSRCTGLPRSSSASSRVSNTTAARRSSLRIFFSFLSSFITSFGFSLVFFSPISFLRGSVSFTFFFLPSSYVTIFSLGVSSKMIFFFLRSFPSLDLCTLSLTTFSTLSFFFLMTASSGKRISCCCFFFFFSIGSFLSRPDFSFFFSPF